MKSLKKMQQDLAETLVRDGSEHIPGVRCVDGLVTGSAGKIPSVTNRNKKAAEDAVRDAGRQAAIADAQKKCDKGSCSDPKQVCTFVKMFEAVSITTTPSRDPQGRIQWTAKLNSFDVFGPCVCREKPADESNEGGDDQSARGINQGYFSLPDGSLFRFGLPASTSLVFIPGQGGHAPFKGEPVAFRVGEVCQDQLDQYETTFEQLYNTIQNLPLDQNGRPISQPCPTPSMDDEINGLAAAKNALKRIARGYCRKGSCGEGETCEATVTNIRVRKTGTSSRIVQNGTTVDQQCFVTFAVSGQITCQCASNT